ncbi:MAG: type I-B CRISPR-associated endonuclease Cas1b [Conexivisphaera sp.]
MLHGPIGWPAHDHPTPIYAEGSVTVKAGAARLLMRRGIPVHFLGRDGSYLGTLWPREHLLAGEVVVRQAEHYLDPVKRLALARKFVRGGAVNIMRNLEHYRESGAQLEGAVEAVRDALEGIGSAGSVEELMGIEGNMREAYYNGWNSIMPEEFRYSGRTRRPPRTMLDALISFGNSLAYSTCLTELYHTQLNPTISYLHEPSERRFSLALDISEVFKPVLVDRTIFRLVRQERMDGSYFDENLNRVLLNERGRRKFVEAYEERLSSTIRGRKGRKASLRRLVRLEAYKLLKHVLGMEEYEPVEVGY